MREDGTLVGGAYLAGEIIGSANIAGHNTIGGIGHGLCATWGRISAESAVKNARQVSPQTRSRIPPKTAGPQGSESSLAGRFCLHWNFQRLMSTTDRSLTLVPVGPVTISPSIAFSA